ncbi:unnamed protein product [Arctogadus glacialis]
MQNKKSGVLHEHPPRGVATRLAPGPVSNRPGGVPKAEDSSRHWVSILTKVVKRQRLQSVVASPFRTPSKHVGSSAASPPQQHLTGSSGHKAVGLTEGPARLVNLLSVPP